MSKRYDTKEAVQYMAELGVRFSPGTLEVWRCQKRGPAYIRIGRKPYYTSETLESFLAGQPVKTIDSMN